MVLKVGDTVPNFKATDHHGNEFDSKNIVGIKPAVIYFYPKDNTRGCTAQACSFRDRYEDFKDFGAEVIGISSDTVVSHEKFAGQYQLPFVLLSDEENKIRSLFGVPDAMLGLLPGRVTYVIDKKGSIIMIFDSSFMIEKHIDKALQALQNIAS